MVCRDVARAEAQRQFETKTVTTCADLSQHLSEFDRMWESKLVSWHTDLAPAEAAKFDKLTTEAERAAFRIIRDFNRSAQYFDQSKFPISRDSLAARIRMTGEGAGKLRYRFCQAGIIERKDRAVPHTHCAFYRWTAGEPSSASSGTPNTDIR